MINYKKLKINRINQFNTKEDYIKGVYHGLWRFNDIINSIRFTYRTPKLEFYENVFSAPKQIRNENDYYQRLVSSERTVKIIDFIITEIKNKDSVITFPSSFIVSLQTFEIEGENEYLEVLNNSSVKKLANENFGVFLINKNEIILPELDLMLIVDGQHRLAAIQVLYNSILVNLGEKKLEEFEEDTQKVIKNCQKKLLINEISDFLDIKTKIENFSLSITLLLDFDIWEQGKVFADVNFNQKPVNRSLYYDIYGSYPNEDKNDIYLLHKWCVKLNSDIDSELKGKINLLGSGKGFISQAFLCDALLPYLRKGGIWYKIANDFTLERQDDTNKIEKFLKAYFNSFAKKYGIDRNSKVYFWPNEDDVPRKFDSILLKTTGLGAVIDLIPNVYNLVAKELDIKSDELENEILKIFDERLTEKRLLEIYQNNPEKLSEINQKLTGELYFSKSNGKFSGGAGKGMQNKLFQELMTDLKFTRLKEKEQFSLFN
jgi:hypothetical protein